MTLRTAASLLLIAAALPAAAEPMVVRSVGQRFVLRVSGLERPEPVNRLRSVNLALATADGRAVSGATIRLSGERRFSHNPLPTAPQASRAPGEGRYKIDGLRFHMPGLWRLVLDIDLEQISDRAILEIDVE